MNTPLRSIREKCLDCSQTANQVRECPCDGENSTFCALWPYRFGRRPDGGKKRVLSEDQRERAIERLKKARKVRMAQFDAPATF